MEKYIITAIAVLLIGSTQSTAENLKEVKTNPIVVSATRQPSLYSEVSRVVTIISKEQITNAPVKNVDDLLEYVSGVDMRQRGGPSAQADFSIRGGTFDQTLILLNGIPFNSPQTGHHNGNIPVSINDIERIEILEGSGGRVLGTNAFSGGINIITKKAEKDKLINFSASGGEFGYYDMNLSAMVKPLSNLSSYYSIFRQKSDGYIANTDTDVLNVYGYNSLETGMGNFSLQFGANKRNFGANSFYTAAFPNQYESTTAAFASLNHSKVLKNFDVSSQLYFNTHYDRFELFRGMKDVASWYAGHNYHRTDVMGAKANAAFTSSFGASSIGVDYRHEAILSNVLGEKMNDPIKVSGEKNAFYTHDDARDNVSLFIEQSISLERFNVSAGVLANWNSAFDVNFYGGIDASYKISNSLRAFASVNQSGRLPNYTDLYYEGPTNKGNPNLKPEESLSFETGVKYINEFSNSNISVFNNIGKNLIDWVKHSDSTLWETQNLTELNTFGFQTSITLYPASLFVEYFPVKFVNLGYTFISSNKNSEEMESMFALDYLRHKFTLSTGVTLAYGFGFDARLAYQEREGTYYSYSKDKEVPYKEVLLAGGRLYYQYDFLNVYCDVENIFDTKYEDIANITQPGRWMRLGFSVSIK